MTDHSNYDTVCATDKQITELPMPQQPPDQRRSEAVTAEQERIRHTPKAIAAAVSERLIVLRHADNCNVHEPTLRLCSCGLETRMRQLISDQSATIAERDRTIAALRAEVATARLSWQTYERLAGEMKQQIAALQVRIANIVKAVDDWIKYVTPIQVVHGFHFANLKEAVDNAATPTTEK